MNRSYIPQLFDLKWIYDHDATNVPKTASGAWQQPDQHCGERHAQGVPQIDVEYS